MSLHYLTQVLPFEILITQVLPLRYQIKKLRNLTQTMAFIFARCESSWLQCVGILQENVYKTHHWSGWTETATENGVDQAGSHHHCCSHSSVASSIAADQWRMCCTPLLQYFPHSVINWIQIWRIWMPQLRWINSGVSLSNNSVVARAQWELSFTR